MKKVFHWFVRACTDEQQDIKIRTFRVILLLGELACLLSTVSNLILGVSYLTSACASVGCLLLALAFVGTVKLKDCRNLIAVMLFLTNSFLFPLIFVFSGGIDSGAPIWLAFGIALVFMFLEGVRLYVVLTTSILSMIAAYVTARFFPDSIRPLASEGMALSASCLSVVVIGVLFGLIFFVQSHIYERARKLAEEQRETIRQISDSRNLFFANMSHEIRTPINTIIGLNEMTLREDISDEVAENARNIQNASKILLALINDILDLSKIESGRMEIVPAQYDTASLFSDLVNIIWVRAHEKKLEFQIDIAHELPSVLYGDEVRIKQVLVNLLTNAVKYTQKGSVSLTVKCERTDADHVLLRMEVKDTGIGIKSEHVRDLFSSFKRVDEEKNRKIEGTGLGLSISKQLVDMMGGTITVDSIYTKGSVFTVTLTQQIVNEAPVGSIGSAVRQSAASRPKYKRRFEAPEARVLIVDDNEMNLMVAKKLLRATRVQVDTASSGAQCLQKTLETDYHVIFMDHVMPEMDGEETLKALRARKEGYCQKTPVVALTANVMSNAAEHYAQMGFDSYLAKPINAAVFEALLQKLLPENLIEAVSSEAGGEIADRISTMMIQGKKKRHVRITTDCVCDLPAELLKKYDVRMMYYYIETEEGRFKDTIEISSDNLLEYMESGRTASSTAASIPEYETFFADSLMDAETVIHITTSAKIGQAYDVAARAAHGFDNVIVLDSGHLSSGLGFIVLHAAKLAQENATPEEITAAVEQVKALVNTAFMAVTPDNLYRSGRIGKKIYLLTHHLHMHPVLQIANGRLYSYRTFIGRIDASHKRFVHFRLRARKKIDSHILFVPYTGCTAAQLAVIRAEIEKRMHFEHIYFQQASCSIASNSGIGALGIIYVKKP